MSFGKGNHTVNDKEIPDEYFKFYTIPMIDQTGPVCVKYQWPCEVFSSDTVLILN